MNKKLLKRCVLGVAATLGIAFNSAAFAQTSATVQNLPQSMPTIPEVQMLPGTLMPDGSIYAGSKAFSEPGTKDMVFVTAKDAPYLMNFDKAKQYCEGLVAHGRDDWRLPSHGKMEPVAENAYSGAMRGTFKEGKEDGTKVDASIWYWVDMVVRSPDHREVIRMDDKMMVGDSPKTMQHSVRCVRTVRTPTR